MSNVFPIRSDIDTEQTLAARKNTAAQVFSPLNCAKFDVKMLSIKLRHLEVWAMHLCNEIIDQHPESDAAVQANDLFEKIRKSQL